VTRLWVFLAVMSALVIGVPLAGGTTLDLLLPPTIDPASEPANPTNQTSASFAFADLDPTVTAFQCQLDDGGFSLCSSPKAYFGLGDGSHTFYVKAIDVLGQESDASPYTWTIDTLGPDAPTIVPASKPPNPTNQTSANFVFSDTDPTATSFKCQLDGLGFSPCSSPQPYSGLTPNAFHTFDVKALDLLVNESEVASYTWEIDTLGPDAPTIDPASEPPNPTNKTSAKFVFSSDPTAISFKCQLDNGGFSPCSSPQLYPVLLDGSHTFDVKALDVLVQESAVSSYAWTVDTVNPLVTLSDKPPPITNRRTASFSFSSSKKPSTYECKLDGAITPGCTDASPVLYTDLGDGPHTFEVQATTASTTTGPPTTYTWTVDTVAPGTTITATPPAVSNSAFANFAFASSEAGSTFFCSLDAGGMTPCDSPNTYSGLGDGAHTFRVEAVDAAGNADVSPAVYAWQIAGVGPATTDTTPPGNVKRLKRNVGYRSLKLSWSRPSDSDFDHVEVFVSTSAKSLPRTPVYKGTAGRYTNKRFKNGLYYRYAVVSYDHAGNASRGAAAVVPPSILLRSPRDGRRVHAPPLLVWAGVSKATFYNVQLYHGAQKVLSVWPKFAKVKLSRSWRYEGRSFQLRKGSYRWYVWPGFGPRSKPRYGQLLGQSVFRVR
jgi:hypothetical protein